MVWKIHQFKDIHAYVDILFPWFLAKMSNSWLELVYLSQWINHIHFIRLKQCKKEHKSQRLKHSEIYLKIYLTSPFSTQIKQHKSKSCNLLWSDFCPYNEQWISIINAVKMPVWTISGGHFSLILTPVFKYIFYNNEWTLWLTVSILCGKE